MPAVVELTTIYVVLGDIIQTPVCFDDWSSVSVRQQVYDLLQTGIGL